MRIGSFALDFIEANSDPTQPEEDMMWDEEEEGGPAMAGQRGDPQYRSSRGATHYVYVNRNRQGKIDYVGITTDLEGRRRQHRQDLHPLGNPPKRFTESEARGIESAVMTKFPGCKRSGWSRGNVQIDQNQFRNQRLSIGRKRRFMWGALQRGLRMLRNDAPDILAELGV